MSEENDGQQAGTKEVNEFEPITSQEALDKLIGARINKVKSQFADYDALKEKASKYDEAEQASKSEIEKEREARLAAEQERDSLLLATARAEVALAKGLTPTQAKRLVGSTKEELEADADELLADLKPTKDDKKFDVSKLKSGSSGSSDHATGKERAAAALRQMRSGR